MKKYVLEHFLFWQKISYWMKCLSDLRQKMVRGLIRSKEFLKNRLPGNKFILHRYRVDVMVAFLIISFYNIVKDDCPEGGIIMDIAAASMSLASLKLGMEVSTSVTKKAMESAETNTEAIVEMLEAVNQMNVPSDNIIDVRA